MVVTSEENAFYRRQGLALPCKARRDWSALLHDPTSSMSPDNGSAGSLVWRFSFLDLGSYAVLAVPYRDGSIYRALAEPTTEWSGLVLLAAASDGFWCQA